RALFTMIDRAFIYNSASRKWHAYRDPIEVVCARCVEDVIPSLMYVEEMVEREGKYAVGFVSYEAARAFDESLVTNHEGYFPLLCFALFSDCRELSSIPREDETFSLAPWVRSISPSAYEEAFQVLRSHLMRGDTYQGNLTWRAQARFSG